MKRQRRFYFWALLCFIGLVNRYAAADAYDPPVSYYNAATGTGATLKGQLYTITSTGFIARDYGDARYAFELIDKDPANSNNILLIYNRASVDGTWDLGVTFNREHVWPKSWLNLTSDQVDNDYSGVASDLFELRPSDKDINSARGNEPYGYNTTNAPHAYGHVTDLTTGTYWYPGDADRGDAARTIFYMATRYGQGQAAGHNLSLVNDQPALYQMGDLASYIKWNFEDAPDTFERRRNQFIYSSTDNPLYYQNNRNPYIDHPEWVWSVYVDQNNDSQISIQGGTTNANGSSTRTVDLGRVFVNGAVPAAQAFTLNKGGDDGTYFEATTSGAATSSLSGRFNAMRTNQTDSKSINVGLSTSTSTAGLKSGSVTINNLDITTGGGTGHGANDANDTFNVSLAVLDHATPSFASPTLTTSLNHDFGNTAIGTSAPTFNFDVYNLLVTAGYTANMDFDNVTPSGSTAAFSTNLAASAGSLSLAGGAGHTFMATLSATTVGTFTASYTLAFSDENITGALNKSLTLSLTGKLRLAGDYNGDLTVDAGDYTVWRNTMGQAVTAYSSADGDGSGTIDILDFDVWRAHFGQTASGAGAGSGFSAAVPEPSAGLLALIGAAIACHSRRRTRTVSGREGITERPPVRRRRA